MCDKACKHIAIIGGGTAGWLAALMLQKASANADSQRLSVIESPAIPTVGVGEGSTSIFRQVLLDLGIDEHEFVRETGATLKFGIKHAGWRKDGRDYFGPIDDPNALAQPPNGMPSNWLHHAQIASGNKVADSHLFTALMRSRKSAFALKQDRLIPLSPFHHAYHFDQARLGQFLSTKASGINHIKTQVEGLQRDPTTGHITTLCCSDDRQIPVDFVIDCTGFSRAIIKQLGSKWESYAHLLPLNKAMPFWLEHDKQKNIPPYTLAQAMGSGWMWAIPVQQRMGCGYVFSDAHTTADQARAEIEAKLGCTINVRRVIDINPGRLQQAWIGNCVAIGLAQSFLEPLEATSIHGSLVQLLLLLRLTPTQLVNQATDAIRSEYNNTVARQVDDYAQFINMHYAGGRVDTPFWHHMTQTGISESQQRRLIEWRKTALTRSDFTTLPYALPHVEEQLYMPVLDGLGLLPKQPSKAVITGGTKAAREAGRKLEMEFASATKQALNHRGFLAQVAKNPQ